MRHAWRLSLGAILIQVVNLGCGDCGFGVADCPSPTPPPTTLPPVTAPPALPSPQTPPIRTTIVQRTSAIASHPIVSVDLPGGYKVIGGGANVNYGGPGNLLTASFPETPTRWTAEAKDHSVSDPASITVYAIGLEDPLDQWDVRLVSATGGTASFPSASVTVPAGYTMTGGGARDNWSGAGNLLTSSFPSSTTSWEGRGKDHSVVSPASITVYAIGIRPRNGSPLPQLQIFGGSAPLAEHPSGFASIVPGFTLSGGGAIVNFSGAGNLLTGSYPVSSTQWSALSKSHSVSSPATVSIFALGIR